MSLQNYQVMVRIQHENNRFCNYIVKVPASEKSKAEISAISLLKARQKNIGKIKKAEIRYSMIPEIK